MAEYNQNVKSDDFNKIKKSRGRKINPVDENPIDDMLIGMGEIFVDSLREIGVTPNMVTTVSLIFGVLSLYYLVIDDVVMFGVCFLLSYYFDCMDGTMARRYSMETKFGDIYDHTTDVFVIIGIICIGVAKFHKHITLTHVLIICFFLVMCQIHIGCQQQLYQLNKATHYYDDEILDDVKKLCTKPENIYITKYFGIGTCVLLMFMYIMYLNLLNNQKI